MTVQAITPAFPTTAVDYIDGAYSTDGTRRAYAVLDTCPDEPEFELGYPVLRIENAYGSWVTRVSDTGYGSESKAKDGLSFDAEALLTRLIEKFSVDEAVEVFDRYLRVFHGGAARVFDSCHRGDTQRYLAYSTAAMVRSWGHEDPESVATYAARDMVDADEWMAYVNGDTYMLVVEQRVTTTYVTRDAAGAVIDEGEKTEWQRIDEECGFGFYGTEGIAAEIKTAVS